MKNFKIGKKLFVVFALIIVFFIATGLVSSLGLNYSGNQFGDFYSYSYPMSNTTVEVRRSIQSAIKNLGMSMLTEDVEDTQTFLDEADSEMQLAGENLNYLLEHYRGDTTRISEAIEQMDAANISRVQVEELAAANQNDKAAQVFFEEYIPIMQEVQDIVTAMDENTTVLADDTYQQARRMQTTVTVISTAISILVLIITVSMASYLTKSLTRPISEIEAMAKEMTKGNMSATVGYESQDEMGSLAQSMMTLGSNTKAIVEDLGHVLSGLAEGNFHIRSSNLEQYVGDYAPILSSMRLLRDNLNETLKQINLSSDQVAMGAAQMSESAQSLAEGATEQAGAVQELTATIEDVSSISENSAKEAEEGYIIVNEAEKNAARSQEDLKELTGAMERISDTSKEIQNIIGAIEDIASQTNLLSLNASIEAARAGEAGKGFAVVADQIGKLASDSAQSAVDTRELIIKALEEIENGNHITAKTVDIIKEILNNMEKFERISKNSSESSKKQSEMLRQISAGIEQISAVVQSNSASAEETSATSEELSAQSEGLKAQVEKFQLI